MSARNFCLLGLITAGLSQNVEVAAGVAAGITAIISNPPEPPPIPNDFDFGAAAKSISAELSSPSFVAYAKPKQKVEEFIAPGDSYTAGTGCNGNDEKMAGDAVRGKRAYPMQMVNEVDKWEFLNGDRTPPRFSFPAYTGDTTVELVSQQLKRGAYKDGNQNLPRNQPFGKPQLAVMTIGGNDAKLSDILNNCVYRAWFPGDCQKTLADLEKDIDDGSLRNKINYGLYQVAHAGRESGGANPRANFQVYVLDYITFFNEVTTPCNDFSWNYWYWNTPKLTTDLRKRFNKLTRGVNAELKKAAEDLKALGVILVEGLDDLYNNHRYCEDRHTSYPMTDYDTWFWSPYSHINTDSEGPGDPVIAYAGGDENPGQQLLDFVFPGQGKKVNMASEASPPWTWPGAEMYPSFQALLTAMHKQDAHATASAPFPLLRSFHPKGTAYSKHKDAVFTAIANNRDYVESSASSGGKYTERCRDWDIKDNHLLVGTCKDKSGNDVRSQAALEKCLYYENGGLNPKDNGQYTQFCDYCFFNDPEYSDRHSLWCDCEDPEDRRPKNPEVKLDDFLTVLDNGFVRCFGHDSTPARRKRW
ncbi:MAG: hypothetical protein Q9160_006911 [Pyrenula sp. 1 TL-2023]